jgi:hypothetical protein
LQGTFLWAQWIKETHVGAWFQIGLVNEIWIWTGLKTEVLRAAQADLMRSGATALRAKQHK